MSEVIRADDYLLRRIPDQPERMWTRQGGVIRPSSAAMKPSTEDGGLSVDVRRLLEGAPPTDVLGDRQADGLVELRAAAVHALGLASVHTPLPGRYSHADITGFAALGKAPAKRVRRELAKAAAWVKAPASGDVG